jgi:hypothetical protein
VELFEQNISCLQATAGTGREAKPDPELDSFSPCFDGGNTMTTVKGFLFSFFWLKYHSGGFPVFFPPWQVLENLGKYDPKFVISGIL